MMSRLIQSTTAAAATRAAFLHISVMTLILLKTRAREERGCWRGGLWPRRAAPARPPLICHASECVSYLARSAVANDDPIMQGLAARAACFSRALIGPAAADHVNIYSAKRRTRRRQSWRLLPFECDNKRRPRFNKENPQSGAYSRGWCHAVSQISPNEEISHVITVWA